MTRGTLSRRKTPKGKWSVPRNIIVSFFLLCVLFSNNVAKKPNLSEYHSISEFIKIKEVVITSENDKWLLLTSNGKKMIFMPQSRFYIVDDKIFQLIYPVWINREKVYINKRDSFRFFNALGKNFEMMKDFEEEISLEIKEIVLEKRLNGYLISIQGNRSIRENHDFDYSINDDHWVYVNFMEAEFAFDTAEVRKELKKGPVKDVLFYSFENSNQIGLKFDFKIDQVEIARRDKKNELMLIFRRNDQVVHEIKEKEEEEEKILHKHGEIKKIIIDPGHGGKDPGAVSDKGVYEKDIVLSIAKELKRRFESRGDYKVIMTRDDDEYVPLEKRRKLANSSGGDVFISIHCNSVSDPRRRKRARGFETYFLSYANNDEARETAKLENQAILFDKDPEGLESDTLKNIVFDLIHNSYMRESQLYAGIILSKMEEKLPVTKRKVDQAGFLILKGLYMPGVLIETGFLSNREEVERLKSSQYQKKIAQAIYLATIEFINQVS